MELTKTVNPDQGSDKDMDISKVQIAKIIRWKYKAVASVIEFVLLFAFWVLISGRFQIKYLLIGVGASIVVTYLTHDLLYNSRTGKIVSSATGYSLACSLRLIAYIPWLVWAVIKCNIQMALIILNPHLPIDPGFLQFKTQLTKKVSMVTLANSVTLTPGTITVDLTNNTFIIHAINRGSASDLESGLMQNKAGAIFCDVRDPAPTCSWVHSCEELER
jgi:multicomponent Na+:H+ antiporter subunit E